MGGSHSSKFLADVNFAKPTVADIQQIMKYFQAQKQPGQEETILNSTQARRFLSKLCKYQQIPMARRAGFVDFLMIQLDKNKDDQLSFEELSDQELWKQVFKLVAAAKTAPDLVWNEKLKVSSLVQDRPAEEKSSINSLQYATSFDSTYAAAAKTVTTTPPSSTSTLPPTSSFAPEDHGAEAFWKDLPLWGKDHEVCEYGQFACGLSEVWECSDDLAQKITETFLPPTPYSSQQVIQKQDFIRFVRACGPWGKGSKNVMIQFILRNFFEADLVTPRKVFHSQLDERKCKLVLKNRGDYLYRYSSRGGDCINVTRFSTNVNSNKELMAETIFNTRSGTWTYEGQAYATLQELEGALKSKLITPIFVGAIVGRLQLYSKALGDPELDNSGRPSGSEKPKVAEKPKEGPRRSVDLVPPMYSNSLQQAPQQKELVLVGAKLPTPGYAEDASFNPRRASVESATVSAKDPYYAAGMAGPSPK
jgi:hypothetical protein